MKHYLAALALLVLLIGVSHSAFAKSAIFTKIKSLGTKKQCSQKTDHSSLNKACKSKKNWGKKVYKCKYKCPKGEKCKKGKGKKWILSSARLCNADGAKKGYYLKSCAGKSINAKSLKKACAQESAKGKVVVYCKQGVEKKRQSCSSTQNNESKKNETRVFADQCGGKVAKSKKGKAIKRNLNKACKTGKYNGKVLVRCNNTCTKRRGLKCTQWTWIEKDRALCGKNEKSAQIKKCSESQARQIADAFESGQTEFAPIKKQMEAFLKNPDKHIRLYANNPKMSKDQRDEIITQVKKALRNAKQLTRRLNAKPQLECAGNQKGLCGKGYDAYVAFSLKKSRYCSSFFRNFDATDAGRVIVHELSHNVGTKDHTYTRSEIRDTKWWNNASSFNSWMRNGSFCIPGWKNCF